ncbi:MAG: hypothetical protein C4520_12210 [Candidatus Abyssobacteria bacterium SURF_5]|uniref:NACHT C-terminal Alpha/Beta 2 domain-containing protein n=1 Tax=Abyssobacteria bacterium (strain SURF_5) TaxID=2093360 RepID=A0A3A4NMY2_ABYX5|nr:MAG: hypothetical protein C4520_12210 [Candidatus Abyssubacteria bacterium SURF_5]
MPLDQIFLQEFNLLITLPFLVSTLGSMAANEVKDFAKALAGKKAAKQVALTEKIREYREQCDLPGLIQKAWSKALRSTVSNDEMAFALADEAFANSLFADLLSQEAANETVDKVLAQREKVATLAHFDEKELREVVPAIHKAFIVTVSKDELLRFLYITAQNQKIFDRLIREGAFTQEQLVKIVNKLQLFSQKLDSLHSEHSRHAIRTEEVLSQIVILLKDALARQDVTVPKLSFNVEAYINGILQNEEEFDAVYVPLDVEAEISGQEGTKPKTPLFDFLQTVRKHERSSRRGRDEEERKQFESMPLAEAIERNPKLVILGEPGAGKSVSLRHLAMMYARKGKQDPDSPLPVLIELKDIGIGGKNIETLIAQELGCKISELDDLLASQKFVFLFDGLNEIGTEHRADGIAEVRTFFGGKHNCYATSRLVGYSDDISRETVEIEPLDEPRIHNFIENYLRYCGSSRTEPEVFNAIQNEHRLSELASNPLMLYMMTTILALQGYSDTPKSRGQLFELFVTNLHKRDSQRCLCKLAEEQWTSLLGALAYEMIDDGGKVAIKKEEAKEILKDVRQKMIQSGKLSPSKHGELFDNYEELLQSGLLREKEENVEFWHQQFQEFYAATALEQQILNFADKDDLDENKQFIQKHLNMPLWEDPLLLVAEKISRLTNVVSDCNTAITAGNRLIHLTLSLDPVFAADLARSCGPAVWKEVRIAVGEHLRAMYQLHDKYYRQVALAGMVASGSNDFVDIFLPLLTSDDRQVRLETYRAWRKFHPSSLGTNWRNVVKTWNEESRVDFLCEVISEGRMANVAEEFALMDPSLNVRFVALQMLAWIDANEAVVQILKTYRDDEFEQVLRDRILHKIPSELHVRALATYKRLLNKEEDPKERLRILFAAAKVGGDQVWERVKEELARWPSGKIGDDIETLLKPALEFGRKSDPEWVSQWVAQRIISGYLWRDHWMEFVSQIPNTLKQNLLERIVHGDFRQTSSKGVLSILAATADAEFAKSIFSRLCEFHTVTAERSKTDTACWEIFGQLRHLFHALPPVPAVSGISDTLAPELDPVQYEVAVDLLGGYEDSDLKNLLRNDLRQALRKYLKRGIPFVLSRDDFSGSLKGHLSIALARVGYPEDMSDLYRLVQADIERRRRALRARMSGERGPIPNGGARSHSNEYTRAIVLLDPEKGEEILLKILREPEYEEDAAKTLVQLAKVQKPGEAFSSRTNYSVIWNSRSGQYSTVFFEDRRRRYVAAIKQRISVIMDDHSRSGAPDSFNLRLKRLAYTIALLDGVESADYVMEIMTLRSEWDDWIRADAVEALLFSGARVQADAALAVLNPVIQRGISKKYYRDEYLLEKCLCLLPFVEPASVGIARIREVIASTRILGYGLRDLVTAIGYSRCDDSLYLLQDLAENAEYQYRYIASEWLGAVAALDTPESRRTLLDFIDPEIEHPKIELYFEQHHRKRLALLIADIARADPAMKDHLFRFCYIQISSRARLLLADIIAELRTHEALLAGLNLIDDQANPPVPDGLIEALENVFLDRHAYGDSGYSFILEPHSANDIRIRLFNMMSCDGGRRRSARTLLIQIEQWRLEYGRPNNEPRHPALDSGERWPPLRTM